MTDNDYLMRVAKRVSLSSSTVEIVLRVAIDEMHWPQIHAFNAERAKGQSIYEDAGGYFFRFIGRLFGVRTRDEVVTYRDAMTAMVDDAINGEPHE